MNSFSLQCAAKEKHTQKPNMTLYFPSKLDRSIQNGLSVLTENHHNFSQSQHSFVSQCWRAGEHRCSLWGVWDPRTGSQVTGRGCQSKQLLGLKRKDNNCTAR